jgi:hypothetical protein
VIISSTKVFSTTSVIMALSHDTTYHVACAHDGTKLCVHINGNVTVQQHHPAMPKRRKLIALLKWKECTAGKGPFSEGGLLFFGGVGASSRWNGTVDEVGIP